MVSWISLSRQTSRRFTTFTVHSLDISSPVLVVSHFRHLSTVLAGPYNGGPNWQGRWTLHNM